MLTLAQLLPNLNETTKFVLSLTQFGGQIKLSLGLPISSAKTAKFHWAANLALPLTLSGAPLKSSPSLAIGLAKIATFDQATTF